MSHIRGLMVNALVTHILQDSFKGIRVIIQWSYPDVYRQHRPIIPEKYNNDVMTCKGFPHYWPFVRGIQRQPVDSPHKGPVKQSFHIFFVISRNKLLNKQLRSEPPRCSCDVTVRLHPKLLNKQLRFEAPWCSCDVTVRLHPKLLNKQLRSEPPWCSCDVTVRLHPKLLNKQLRSEPPWCSCDVTVRLHPKLLNKQLRFEPPWCSCEITARLYAKLLNKQLRFQLPWCSCDVTVMLYRLFWHRVGPLWWCHPSHKDYQASL